MISSLALISVKPATVRSAARMEEGNTLIQYTAMPLAAYGVGRLLGLDGPLLIGVVMVGCVPGAMASNVLTLIARGNVSYSLSLTTMA